MQETGNYMFYLIVTIMVRDFKWPVEQSIFMHTYPYAAGLLHKTNYFWDASLFVIHLLTWKHPS